MGIDQTPCNGCDECGARCTTGVPMTRGEYRALRTYVNSPEGAEARRVERLPRDVPYPGGDDALSATDPALLEEWPTYTACRFRDTELGRCTVYPVRPLVCRLFGHVEWLPCPIGRVAPPERGAGLEVMRRYTTQLLLTYEQWTERDEAGANP